MKEMKEMRSDARQAGHAPPQATSLGALLITLLVTRPADGTALPPRPTWPAILGWTVAGLALYGAVTGCFGGGGQIAVAAFKVPLIVLGSLLLCLPSLFVATVLDGARYGRGDFAATTVGLCGVVAIALGSVLPIVWLFSVSSRSPGFLVFVHLLVWSLALDFGRRYLGRVVPATRWSTLVGWSLLLLVVSLQMTTHLRPVLDRASGEPLFAAVRMSFLEHVGGL